MSSEDDRQMPKAKISKQQQHFEYVLKNISSG